mmetsp:Transcript_25611/g.56473  ORF Transcript_25611/g.56473 Transcript_25611/m.56473 type:complete len:611 (-) Transcript_25611:129-1961(-)
MLVVRSLLDEVFCGRLSGCCRSSDLEENGGDWPIMLTGDEMIETAVLDGVSSTSTSSRGDFEEKCDASMERSCSVSTRCSSSCSSSLILYDLQKSLSVRDTPTVEELDRGVYFERTFDLFEPSKKCFRIVPLDRRVLHQRRSSSSQGSVQRSLASMESLGSDPMQSISALSTRTSNSSMGLHMLQTRKQHGSERASNRVMVLAWGVFSGKMLHSRLLGFGEVTNRFLQERRLQVAAGENQPRVLSSVLGRARRVLFQVGRLARKVGTETIDKLDSEWKDEHALELLFGIEYYDTLMLLATAVRRILASQPALASAKTPSRIFGDLHGQVRDLLLLFGAYGLPETDGVSFVFNGDFVDRGSHQLEVLGILFALKVMLPDKVWLVRGNHEDSAMNEKYGFRAACSSQLGSERGARFFDVAQKTFDYLPLACLVEKSVLVLHGGIGNGSWTLDDLRNLQLPIKDPASHYADAPWIYNILWSDPIDDGKASLFGVHESPRGVQTSSFAWDVTKTFCARNGLSLVIRSHQSKRDSPGFDIMHENMLLRIFSARDYEGHRNDGATALLQDSVEEENLITVRLQVLRTCTKSREESRFQARAAAKWPHRAKSAQDNL